MFDPWAATYCWCVSQIGFQCYYAATLSFLILPLNVLALISARLLIDTASAQRIHSAL